MVRHLLRQRIALCINSIYWHAPITHTHGKADKLWILSFTLFLEGMNQHCTTLHKSPKTHTAPSGGATTIHQSHRSQNNGVNWHPIKECSEGRRALVSTKVRKRYVPKGIAAREKNWL